MADAITFDFPAALWVGIPAAVLVAGLSWYILRRQGLTTKQCVALVAMRLVAMLMLAMLLSRPTLVQSRIKPHSNEIAVLLDCSESMSVNDKGDGTDNRYRRAVAMMRDTLQPMARANGWTLRPVLFSREPRVASGEDIATGNPNGPATDLAAAILFSLSSAPAAPLAVLALTDGAANENSRNRNALTGLTDAGAPFFAVGFGSDKSRPSLTLHDAHGPRQAAPHQAFRISADLEAVGDAEMPAFDLLLLRDGNIQEVRRVPAFTGGRFWTETFLITETEPALNTYTIQLAPPSTGPEGAASSSSSSSAVATISTPVLRTSHQVRVVQEEAVRILFVQGSLTWDYKFIGRALKGDPALRLTGLSRTARTSVFRQNVETGSELLDGFPTKIEQLAPYRVVVLSNLKPEDLTPEQQNLISRFVSELGGGLLMLGGADTFDSTWSGTRLEQLLPVTIDPAEGVRGLNQPFRLILAPNAVQNSVFQIAGTPEESARAWARLPNFTEYGRVEKAKPGALVWATHDTDKGSDGKRILIASQFYGAGISAVITVQNFWRWRMVKETDIKQFDRFWQQFFRYLGQSAREEITIQSTNPDMRPKTPLHFTLEQAARPEQRKEKEKDKDKPDAGAVPAAGSVPVSESTPSAATAPAPGAPTALTGAAASSVPEDSYIARVTDSTEKVLLEQQSALAPGISVPFTFQVPAAGTYAVTVLSQKGQVVARRTIEVRDVNRELQRTARDMDNLRQWAGITRGEAYAEESAPNAADLANRMLKKREETEKTATTRTPLGMNPWIMLSLLTLLATEWVLRKKWITGAGTIVA
ncbi:MAG: hypothetical protein ACAI35_01895 [Candidatus Methylacidiphilales bacterium]